MRFELRWWLTMAMLFVLSLPAFEFGKNVYHSFVTVPRLVPELVYRYMFDRESFYRSRSMEAPPAPAQPSLADDRWLQPPAGPTSQVIF